MAHQLSEAGWYLVGRSLLISMTERGPSMAEGNHVMDTGVETRPGRSQSIAGQGGTDDHVLRFSGVRYGDSCALPLSLQDQWGLPHGLEVVVPPLAPFSVVETRLANHVRPDGRWTGDLATKLWIRYDATSPMATDDGRMVVRDPETGVAWTVQLSGSSELAPIR